MEYVGAGAGGALGFILGNTKGAVAGYHIGKRLGRTYRNKNMAPVRGRTVSRSSTLAPRSHSSSSHRSSASSKRPRSRSTSRSLMSISSAGTAKRVRFAAKGKAHVQTKAYTHLSAVVKKGKKRLNTRKKKPVKVTRKLRSKIYKVIDETKLHGYFQKTNWDSFSSTVDGTQAVFDFPYLGQFNTTAGASEIIGRMFSPLMVFHGVSRAYGQSPAAAYPAFATTQITPSYPVYTGSAFDRINFIVDVSRQWYTQRFKNNSNKTMFIEIYDCQTKSTSTADKPREDWNNALIEDQSAGKNAGGVGGTFTGISTLHTTPYLCKAWAKDWKAQVTKVQLEPGCTWTRNVEGPAIRYDYSKFYRDTVFQENQKFVVNSFMIIKNDLGVACEFNGLSSIPRQDIRPREFTPFLRHLIVESTYHLKYSLPEQVGFTVSAVNPTPPALPGNGRLDKRIEKYVIDVDPAFVGLQTGDFRIDEINPTDATRVNG